MSWQTLTQEHNLDVSIVKLTDIEGLFRIEAEFYNPHFLSKRQTLLNKKTQNLVDIAKLVSGPAYSSEAIAETFDENSIPIVKIGDVTNKRPLENLNYLSKKEFEKFGSAGVNEWDILMTMTGDPPDVGKCNIWQVKEGQVLAFNQRVCKITAKKEISPLVLFAYLSTEYARCFSERYAMGIRQRNVSIKDIRNIPVPFFSSNLAVEIEKNISNHFNLLENSKNEYREAERLLLKEINLIGYKPSEENISVRSFAESLADNRFDAEYWQPDFDKIISIISAYKKEASVISDEFKQIKNNFKKDPKETYKYIEISDVNISTGEVDFNEIVGSELPANAKIKFGKRQLITSKVRPNRGATAILDNYVGYIGSGAFTVLEEKGRINLETLMAYLKTQPIRELLLRYNTGTSYPTITDKDILQLPIPRVDDGIQKQIKEKVAQSHKERQEAKILLEKAKRAVEIFIEQDEKQALVYLNQ